MSSVYSSVDKNKRETAVIFIGFIFFVTAVFYFASLAYFGDSSMLVFAFLFSFVSGFVGYYKSDSLVLAISGAREIKPEDSQYVHSLVENMCIASGLPKPKLYVINDTALNAFATGRSPDKGVICFTSGIIDRLEKRQLEGVIAH
ncbi:MAG TPA: M48 family metalloprotease, partial [bacterium]|nr:M48 family metalloprotease [bacterium]